MANPTGPICIKLFSSIIIIVILPPRPPDTPSVLTAKGSADGESVDVLSGDTMPTSHGVLPQQCDSSVHNVEQDKILSSDHWSLTAGPCKTDQKEMIMSTQYKYTA